jgi:hypothetical protein
LAADAGQTGDFRRVASRMTGATLPPVASVGDDCRTNLKSSAICVRCSKASRTVITLIIRSQSERTMLRAFCFSVGVFVALWGATFLFVEQITFSWKVEPVIERDPSFRGFYVTMNDSKQRVFNPQQWMAFSLMSIGSVTMLYSLVLPKKAA